MSFLYVGLHFQNWGEMNKMGGKLGVPQAKCMKHIHLEISGQVLEPEQAPIQRQESAAEGLD